MESNKIKEQFERLIEEYLHSNPQIKNGGKTAELEIRLYATYLKETSPNKKYVRPISKIDYDNVIKKLYTIGFQTHNSTGDYFLRINNQYIDNNGNVKMSNVRTELLGLDLIQEYCKTNNLQRLLNLPANTLTQNKIKFTQKTNAMQHLASSTKQNNVDFKDFGFRASFQYEEDFHSNSSTFIKEMIAKWTDTKKTFRYLNRVRFYHDEYPIFADVSIVKSSKKSGNVSIPQYTIAESHLFENDESYEIELEIDNSRVGFGTAYNNSKKLLFVIRKFIRHILSAFQNTNYPISFREMEQTQQTYMHLIHGKTYEKRIVFPRDFIGPSSVTLQLNNIIDDELNTSVKITKNMTVTDKADGERRLLYISENGRVYMINTMMNIIFTGYLMDTINSDKDKKTFMLNTILDGEFIKYNKSKEVINLYMAFDIYFLNGKSVREYGFIRQPNDTPETKNRLDLLIDYVNNIHLRAIDDETHLQKNNAIPQKACHFIIQVKQFETFSIHPQIQTENKTIFDCCDKIIKRVKDGLISYNTDGLIFTPSNTGVGSSKIGVAGPLFKATWNLSFKWKPPQFNTIDFLVTIKKNAKGQDEIHNLMTNEGIKQYKTLILMCGYDTKTKDPTQRNPYMDIINGYMDTNQETNDDETNSYRPIPFQPTNPFDSTAYLCNISLHNRGGEEDVENKNTLVLRSEDGDFFEENTIVEFRYDMDKPYQWRWIPIKVRYDKTNELRSKMSNFGNPFHVANSNWNSIHNPITEEIITTGKNIPLFKEDDVYYNRNQFQPRNESPTKALRDFHNLFVKALLIKSVSNPNDTLIDYACGKGGDIPKWIDSQLGFVFGMDINTDNIHNRYDGACARYVNFLKNKNIRKITKCLFVQGDSSLNVRTDGTAFYSKKDKEIARAVFGKGPKDEQLLGKGVYLNYGSALNGFHISSIQFAIHYFFENKQMLHQFCRNVNECTKMGGYFIGTCYDGKTVFDKLKNLTTTDNELSIYKNTTPILKIKKQYLQTGFPNDEDSLGYAIDVFQESINKTFREYLVNYEYLVRIMSDYGFVLLSHEEIQLLNLPASSGLFSELYSFLEKNIKANPSLKTVYGKALNMSNEEKQISFMNRYFIFKKVRNVDAELIAKISKIQPPLEPILNEEVVDTTNQPKNKTRKLKIKIVINKYEPQKTDSVVPLSLHEVKPVLEPEPMQEKVKEKKTIQIKRKK